MDKHIRKRFLENIKSEWNDSRKFKNKLDSQVVCEIDIDYETISRNKIRDEEGDVTIVIGDEATHLIVNGCTKISRLNTFRGLLQIAKFFQDLSRYCIERYGGPEVHEQVDKVLVCKKCRKEYNLLERDLIDMCICGEEEVIEADYYYLS